MSPLSRSLRDRAVGNASASATRGTPVRLAIFGSGYGSYVTAPAFQRIPGVEIVALCSPHADRRDAAAARLGIPRVAASFTDLNDIALDAVAIAVPPHQQPGIVEQAIDRMLPIFAEKPLAADLASAERIAVRAAKAGVITAVDFIFPETHAFTETRRLLTAGAIGQLRHVLVQWHFESYDNVHQKAGWKTAHESGGGALAYFGSHILYSLEWLCGPIADAEIACAAPHDYTRPADTLVGGQMRFDSGAVGQFSLCSAAFGVQRHQITLHGADGVLTLKNFSGNPVAFSLSLMRRGHPAAEIIVQTDDEPSTTEDPRISVSAKIASRFIDAIRSGERVTPSFIDALRVQRLISSAHQLD